MLAVMPDNDSAVFQTDIIEVYEATNPYGEWMLAYDFFDVPVESVSKHSIVDSNSNNEVFEIYSRRIDNFLNKFTKENKVLDRQKVSEIIFDKKMLLGMIESAVSEIAVNHHDKIHHITIRPLSNEEDTFEYIFMTFHLDETVTAREAIDIESEVKVGQKGKTYEAGLSIAFV